MKNLRELFKNIEYRIISGELIGDITELVYDSRCIVENCIYVAISGASFDGHDFVGEALAGNAKAVVIERDIEIKTNKLVIRVDDTRLALAYLSAAYFDYPANEIGVIGITGTKGKTTGTYMIKEVLDTAGFPCGLMGTNETIIGNEHIHAVNTTPESYIIHRDLRKMVNAGMKYCVMEASSQGFLMKRTAGLNFKVGIFTNLSPDHIGPNEHTDFEDYLNCKAMLFRQCEIGIVNADDKYSKDILRDNSCSTITTFGIENKADYSAQNIEYINKPGRLGTRFRVISKENFDMEIPLPGRFSIYNALACICACKMLNIDTESIQAALKDIKVKGRIELVETGGDFALIIDYSHNAVALESILKVLRDSGAKRLVTIFGCGGNRDRQRRFSMGRVSGEFSDFTIITSDNPRFEDPVAIMEDIKAGIEPTGGEYIMIEDRGEAVKYAVSHAKSGDVILLAGKGHEDYQEIQGKRYYMDELTLCKNALNAVL